MEQEQGCKVPITLLESLTKFLGKNSTKRLDQVKGALTLWLSDILIKILPATSDPAFGKGIFFSLLLVYLHELKKTCITYISFDKHAVMSELGF